MAEDIQITDVKQITDEQFIALSGNKSSTGKAGKTNKSQPVDNAINDDKPVNDNQSVSNDNQLSAGENTGVYHSDESKPVETTTKPAETTNESSDNTESDKKKKRPTLKERFSIGEEKSKTENQSNPLNKELEQIKAELQQLKEDPAVKLVLEAKKSNKNLIQALNELRGTSVSSMKDDDIFRQHCRDNGITDEDEIEEELERFNSQSRFVRKEQLEKIKSQYLKEEENRFGQFFKNEPDPQEVKIIEKFQQDIVSHLKSMNQYGGIKMDDSMRKSIIDDIQNNGLIPRLEDGSIDSLKVIDMIMWGRYKKMILDELEKEFTVIGAEMVQDEVEAKPASLVHNKPPGFALKATTGEERAKQASESLTYLSA